MAGSLGELVEVSLVDVSVLVRVVGLEIRFADVVDQIVLLPGNQPGLRGHLAKTIGKCAIHVVGIGTVLERRADANRGAVGSEPARSLVP